MEKTFKRSVGIHKDFTPPFWKQGSRNKLSESGQFFDITLAVGGHFDDDGQDLLVGDQDAIAVDAG